MPGKKIESNFLHTVEVGYPAGREYAHEVKENWKHVSKSYFSMLARDLDLDQSNVWFNPGGIAVSGDIDLMGMKDGCGFHLFGNLASGFAVRSAKSLTDFSGGLNHKIDDLSEDNLLTVIRDVLGVAEGAL